MIGTDSQLLQSPGEPLLAHTSIRGWQRDCATSTVLPVVGIAGTRGKSTVLRLVDAVLQDAHLRRATWTDLGVHIQGRRQSGELAGWSHSLMRLNEGSLDLALQELDWATVNAVGLPNQSYPLMALCGLREHTESPEDSPALMSAIRAAHRCVSAVHHAGVLIVNGDDYYAVDAMSEADATVIVVAQSHRSPALMRHLSEGGSGVWVRHGYIWIGDQHNSKRLTHLSRIPITMNGEASFNVVNVLLAIAICRALGMDLSTIIRTIEHFRAAWDILPASMNVYETDDYRCVIDQMGPGWVLKSVLRAINPASERRQITVVGDLTWITEEDVFEFGRQLGRYHGAIVMHGDQDSARLGDFRRGLASNEYPPLLIRLPTERRAVNRAFNTLNRGDVLLILTTHDSSAAHRAVKRHIAPI